MGLDGKRCWICLCAAVLSCLGLIAAGCKKAPPTPTTMAVPVVAMEVLIADATNYVESVGQTFGVQDVEIRARVAGFLDSVHFAEGSLVRSNELLYVIDDRPFKAALAESEGVLAQAMAAWEKARRDTNRLGPLWERNAISRQQLDDAVVSELTAAAHVKSAQATVEAASIQLGYTRIRSPLDGIAGKNEVSVGNLVGQGQSTLLTAISDVRSVNVRFSLSEQDYLAYRRKHYTVESGIGVFELILADGNRHPHRNVEVFAGRQVDPRTGTLLVQARFPNPEGIIRPGQFARVRFPSEVFAQAVLVPQRAVQELQATYSTFVVGKDDRAEFRSISVGPRLGSFFVVTSGLKSGDRVVLEGAQKLRSGAPVVVTMTNLVLEVTPRHWVDVP